MIAGKLHVEPYVLPGPRQAGRDCKEPEVQNQHTTKPIAKPTTYKTDTKSIPSHKIRRAKHAESCGSVLVLYCFCILFVLQLVLFCMGFAIPAPCSPDRPVWAQGDHKAAAAMKIYLNQCSNAHIELMIRYPMLRNGASGLAIGLPGHISDGF